VDGVDFAAALGFSSASKLAFCFLVGKHIFKFLLLRDGDGNERRLDGEQRGFDGGRYIPRP
jgi:hypothetical protein